MRLNHYFAMFAVFVLSGVFLSGSRCENSTRAEKNEAFRETLTNTSSKADKTDIAESESTAEDAEKADYSPLSRIIFITTSKACHCTMDRCRRGEDALKTALEDHPGAPDVERLDYAKQRQKVMELVRKYKAVMLPIIYFLDEGDGLLWKADGEIDPGEIDRILESYKREK